METSVTRLGGSGTYNIIYKYMHTKIYIDTNIGGREREKRRAQMEKSAG